MEVVQFWRIKLGNSPQSFYGERNLTIGGFKVLLDTVVLKRNTEYYVHAKIIGPYLTCGNNGDSTVTCSGVTFTFKTFPWPGNNTTVQVGQFPGLMFSL